MTEQQTPYPSEDQHPTPSAPQATTGAAEEPTSGKARRWLAGAMLVTVGLVAGSGTTYAFTSNPTSNAPGTTSGYGRGGFGGGQLGGPPPGGFGQSNGTVPDQQGQSDQGTTPPSAGTGTGTGSQLA
jgi:hypothetical protein